MGDGVAGGDGMEEGEGMEGGGGTGGVGGGWKIVMMCEVPSNALLAEEFLERFDGFSHWVERFDSDGIGFGSGFGLGGVGF